MWVPCALKVHYESPIQPRVWAGGVKQQAGQNWVSCSASRHKTVTRTRFALLPQTTSKLGKHIKQWLISRHWTSCSSEHRPRREGKQNEPYNHPVFLPRCSFQMALWGGDTQTEPVVLSWRRTEFRESRRLKSLGQHARAEGISQTQIPGSTWDWLRTNRHVPGKKQPQTRKRNTRKK